MAVALLVMGFREPEVLRSAVPIYKAAGFEIFVHLDAKADINAYKAHLGETAVECSFIEDRHNIFWGGFSMIEAQIALIRLARSSGDYDRFTLVSDDTYPIISASLLKEYFLVDYDRVMIRKLENDDPFMRRYSNFFFLDHQVTSLLGRPIESTAIGDDFFSEMTKLELLRERGKKIVDVYYGSQWWSISRVSMVTILEALESDRHLLESFRYSAVPDELLFQTLVGNFISRSRVRSGPVFVEWSLNPKPYIFKDFVELNGVNQDFAFARKFSHKNRRAYEDIKNFLQL